MPIGLILPTAGMKQQRLDRITNLVPDSAGTWLVLQVEPYTAGRASRSIRTSAPFVLQTKGGLALRGGVSFRPVMVCSWWSEAANRDPPETSSCDTEPIATRRAPS